MTSRIPFNRVTFLGDELANMTAALDNGHVSGNGPFTKRAEALLESRLHGARVLLTTSCTHALEMAALLLDLEPGDEIIVPSFTFVSTASAFALHGGRPVFVDIDPWTLNIDPAAVEAAITPRTRAICAVHYGGVPASPESLLAIADASGAVLIEDAAHAFPSETDRPLGTYGALGTLSFHETKNVTCGEGGALVVNDRSLVERAEILREKGTDRARFQRGLVDKYTWVDIGSSYVLSDLNAAILVGQLKRLDVIQAARRQRYDRYVAALGPWAAAHDVLLPPDGPHSAHVFHLRLPDQAARDALIEHLAAAGILAVFHYQPLHMSLVGRRFGGCPGQLPVSEDVSGRIVRLPLFETLGESDQTRVIDAVLSFSR